MVDDSKLHITWEELEKDCRDLADMLQKQGPVHGIVGIARGGLVPAAIITNALNIRNVKTVAITSYNGSQQVTAELLGSVDTIKDGEGWIFVDDLVDTGQTAKLIHKRYPKAKLAVVYAKPDGQESTDFFVRLLKQEAWVVFPWEAKED
jgi:xanthine phosphoribosyltransferase